MNRHPYLSPAGSISGFENITVDPAGTPAEALPPAPFSITDLIARWRKLSADLNPARLQNLAEMIETHLYTEGSVHNLTADNIGNVTYQAVLKTLLPGTVPPAPPTMFISAVMSDVESNVTVARTGTMYVTDVTGKLVAAPADTLVADYGVDGTPMIPIFPERTNYFTTSGAVGAKAVVSGVSSRLVDLNSTSAQTDGSIKGPDDGTDVLIVTDTADVGVQHGVELKSIGCAGVDTTVNVTSFFVIPINSTKLSLELFDDASLLDLSSFTATIDLTTGAVLSEGGGFDAVYVHRHPSGWWRVGVQYAIVGTTNIGLRVAGFSGATPEYTGDGTTKTIGIACINTTHGAGLAPYILSTGATTTVGGTVLTFDGETAINGNQGIFLFEWLAYQNTAKSTGSIRGTDLFKIDGVSVIALNDTNVIVTRGAASSTVAYANNEYTATAVSYSLTQLIHKTTGQPKDVVDATITGLSGTFTCTIGSAPGYMQSFTIYPLADLAYDVNYLTGESD